MTRDNLRKITNATRATQRLTGPSVASEYKGAVAITNVDCIYQTDRALLCVIDSEEHWIPQSVVHNDSEVYKRDDTGTLIVQRWFAVKAGLV